jgi:hypothetical protein
MLLRMTVVLSFLFVPAVVRAGPNLVVNPGFETGTLANWTSVGSFGWGVGSSPAATHTGTYSAGTGCGGSGCISNPDAGLYQDLTTLNGQSYSFSFWYANTGGSPNELQVLWGGTVVSDLVNQPGDSVWRQITLNETATSGTTRIQFNGRNDPNSARLDDVSVTANAAGVPEPGTIGLLLGGVAVLGITGRIKQELSK